MCVLQLPGTEGDRSIRIPKSPTPSPKRPKILTPNERVAKNSADMVV